MIRAEQVLASRQFPLRHHMDSSVFKPKKSPWPRI